MASFFPAVGSIQGLARWRVGFPWSWCTARHIFFWVSLVWFQVCRLQAVAVVFVGFGLQVRVGGLGVNYHCTKAPADGALVCVLYFAALVRQRCVPGCPRPLCYTVVFRSLLGVCLISRGKPVPPSMTSRRLSRNWIIETRGFACWSAGGAVLLCSGSQQNAFC